MSRRLNGVRGPSSALTEYLRSTGITPTTIAQRAATRQENEAGPSNVEANNDGDVEMDHQRPNRRRTARANTDGYASDNLDEPPTPQKRRKLTHAAAKKKAKKDANGGDDEDEDDAYTALSKSVFNNSSSKPPTGSMEDCAKCSQQFTVTKYTMAAIPGPGWLCHNCAKASGSDPFKKPAPPRKRKTITDKRKITHFDDHRCPSLVSLCVQVVSKHIDDVEALGDIGAVNLQEIAKAIAKNRSLSNENVKLFYGVMQPSLVLYDATNLPSLAYETLAMLNPSLTSLRLDFCGRMNCEALDSISSGLPVLTHIELLGPFLVRSQSWQNFLRDKKLISFKITQSPRFDLDCLQKLLETSRETLEELRLCEIGKLDDSFLQELQSHGSSENEPSQIHSKLKYLDISFPAKSCSPDALVDLFAHIGSNIQYLNLSGHQHLSDDVFANGIQLYCHKIESLVATHTPDVSDAGIASFFTGWQNPPLKHIDFSRNAELSSNALMAILSHSASELEYLNINGWKETSLEALTSMAKRARELRQVDMGWCREVNDFVIQELITGNETEHRTGLAFLNTISVFGCGRVNGTFHRKKTVTVHGLEGHQP